MRKNGSRILSVGQYRLTDLLLFTVILVVYDLLAQYALQRFAGSLGLFAFTLTVPIVVLIMMRWGWWSVFFAVGDGILLSALINPTMWQAYVSLSVGNAAMMLLLIPLKLIGKKKIAGKWYFSALFVISAWILSVLGISVVQTICGFNFAESFAANAGVGRTGLLALFVAVLLITVLRRFDGMFEDQVTYLKRLDKERREKMEGDNFGWEPIEISEEDISILKKDDEDL